MISETENKTEKMIPDVWCHIFGFVPTRFSRQCAAVCSEWHNITKRVGAYRVLKLWNAHGDQLLDILLTVPHLRVLHLNGPMSSIQYSLSPLLDKLGTVDLNYDIRDIDISGLRGLSHLQHVYLRNCSLLTDASLHVFSYSCPQVKELHLFHYDNLTRHGIKALNDLHTLQTLKLSYCYHLNGMALQALKHPGLRSLSLSYCQKFRDKDFGFLSHCPALVDLSIVNLRITDISKHLQKLDSLVTLNVSYCMQLGSLVLPSSELMKVNLNANLILNSVSFTHLHKLDLSYTEVRDDSLMRLPEKLQKLYLRNCQKITDAGVAHLHVLKHLWYLNLRSCLQVSPTGLRWVNADSNLRVLNVLNCPRITRPEYYRQFCKSW
jgi:hypothetical protein